MADMRYLEVRCCCQPMKLLGYLPATGPLSAKMRFVIWGEPDDNSIGYEYVELSIGTICVPPDNRYGVIKAEGMTLEELRRIPSFRETAEEEQIWRPASTI